MSLKAFHVFFIFAATLLCAFFAWWALREGGAVNQAMGAASAVSGVALATYGRWFLRKTKDVSYL